MYDKDKFEQFLLSAVNPTTRRLWAPNHYPHAKFQPGDKVLLGNKEYIVLAYNHCGGGHGGIEYMLKGRGFLAWECELEEVNHV